MSEKMYTFEEIREIYEKAVGDRAKWFALFARYTPKDIFPEIAKKAVWDFGAAKKDLVEPSENSSKNMARFLASGMPSKVFKGTVFSESDEKSVLHIEYCPLIRGWREMGCTDEEIAYFCDLICSGDYALADVVGLECKFGKLLSHGDDYCEMILTTKK